MTRWTTEAIVLGQAPLLESDKLVRLFTPGQGRLSVVAKGAQRSKKRFVGVFDLAVLLDAGLMTAPRSGRVMIEHACLKQSFPEFRRSPLRLARACLLLETVSLAAPEHQADPQSFQLLRQGLCRLAKEPDSDRWALIYSMKLLSSLGYRPSLDSCVRCHKEPSQRQILFSPHEGGVVCEPCCRAPAAGQGSQDGPPGMSIKVSIETLKTLVAVMNADHKLLARIRFSKTSLAQARGMLASFAACHLAGPSRTLEFMEKIA